MGRRKKEPRSIHREKIASAAHQLFIGRGIAHTTMNDIAQAAGYSKATLYVYFQDKEEIVALLVLESMKKLKDCMTAALEDQQNTKKRYELICQAMLEYQEQFPFYFSIALEDINIDFSGMNCPPEEEETFRVGEEINAKLRQMLLEGILAKELKADIDVLPVIMAFWGMLSGLIQLGSKKERYIEQELKLSKRQFLQVGFDTLYRSIAMEENK